MFEEVGNPLLMLLLIQRAYVHVQAHAGPALGLCSGADDVLHAVGQLPLHNLRVNLQLCLGFCSLLQHFCLRRFLGTQHGAAHGKSHERE